MRRSFTLALGLVIGTMLATATGISYTCDSSVDAATCNYLNTTVAGLYSSTFTNANASIYITYGTTALAQTQSAFNVVSYSQYVAALTANQSDAIQTSAVSALNTNDAA